MRKFTKGGKQEKLELQVTVLYSRCYPLGFPDLFLLQVIFGLLQFHQVVRRGQSKSPVLRMADGKHASQQHRCIICGYDRTPCIDGTA